MDTTDTPTCLDRHKPDHTCAGPVTGQPSHAGTGTLIYRCEAGHDAADAWAREIRERGGSSFAAYYALLVGRGMNTTGAFPICDDHLAGLQKQTAGGQLTVHLSERLIVGHH